MSNRELAKNLIDQISDAKLLFVIPFLQGASLSDETPNSKTLEAIAEVDEMIRTGSGQHFTGTAEEFTNMLLLED